MVSIKSFYHYRTILLKETLLLEQKARSLPSWQIQLSLSRCWFSACPLVEFSWLKCRLVFWLLLMRKHRHVYALLSSDVYCSWRNMANEAGMGQECIGSELQGLEDPFLFLQQGPGISPVNLYSSTETWTWVSPLHNMPSNCYVTFTLSFRSETNDPWDINGRCVHNF